MNTGRQPARLAGAEIDRGCHVCAFFHDREEEYRLLLPFMQEGLDRGDKLCQILDVKHREERLRRLAEAGVKIDPSASRDQCEVRVWEDAHLREGRFDQYAMLALIEEILTSGKGSRSGLTRFWANMEWSLEDRPGVRDILEYEARLNSVLPNYDDVVVCTYDLHRFSAPTVMDILRTHPMVIVGGILQQNPFYVPPDEFLRELQERTRPAVSA
jgi:hypothetical protein